MTLTAIPNSLIKYITLDTRLQKQLNLTSTAALWVWRIVGGIVAPLGVFAVFVYTLKPVLEGFLK